MPTVFYKKSQGLRVGSDSKEFACNGQGEDLFTLSGSSLEKWNGSPLQYC